MMVTTFGIGVFVGIPNGRLSLEVQKEKVLLR